MHHASWIAVASDDPLSYRWHEGWCEGTYEVKVATEFVVASYAVRRDSFEDPIGDLRINWPDGSWKYVAIQGESLYDLNPYRIDAIRRAEDGSWVWPTATAEEAGVFGGDLVFLGRVDVEYPDSTIVALLPLQIGTDSHLPSCGQFRLTVVPDLEDIADLYVRVAAKNATGVDGSFSSRHSLDWPEYPDAIPVPLPRLDSSGVYKIEIAVKSEDGTSSSVAVNVFFQGGWIDECR